MSEQPTNRRTSPWIVWPVCVFILVVLYIGSYGPFCWCVSHDKISLPASSRLYHVAYFPLHWIHTNTDFFRDNPAGRAYVVYLDWWD